MARRHKERESKKARWKDKRGTRRRVGNEEDNMEARRKETGLSEEKKAVWQVGKNSSNKTTSRKEDRQEGKKRKEARREREEGL